MAISIAKFNYQRVWNMSMAAWQPCTCKTLALFAKSLRMRSMRPDCRGSLIHHENLIGLSLS